MYGSKEFSIRPLQAVLTEIEQSGRIYSEVTRVFLADGDDLVAPVNHLFPVLDALQAAFPNLERVSCYALPANLRKQTVDELIQLRAHKPTLIYYGIESGSVDILKPITRGATPESMIQGLNKASQAGLQISATVILGKCGITSQLATRLLNSCRRR